KAYRHLFKYHYPVLCHFAEGLIRDEFLAETIVGDVIFHLWEIRKDLDISGSIRSYLMTAVRNRCLDFLKSSYFRNEMASPDPLSEDFPIIDYVKDADSPLGRLLEKELEGEISKAVDSLPGQTLQVFRMSRFEGKKYEEIASSLGISVNTVKYHIKQALAHLREHLGDYLSVAIALMMQDFFK
ncbi:MAG: RNA polymerase sigma-70 factor, partial [Bacteroidales bacterium]|nr:RNA polymerase sigma-70 factor [Bacteroidales bacterium]